MVDLIVFNVSNNRYAMNIANVQRIVQATRLTPIPNSHPYIDGMMSYEKSVIKVLNFRKLISLDTYESDLKELFITLKRGHKEWVESLRESLQSGIAFTQALDPHACGLGKWLDSFTAYDEQVVEILNELTESHKELHLMGSVALETYEKDKEEALKIFNKNVLNIFKVTMGSLDTFTQELDLVSDSLQKFIIYDNNGATFAIKVDTIEDIAHVEESEFIDTNDSDKHDFLELDSVLDLKGVLINVIKTVKIPS
ncbi:hypothetical protein GJV85_09260 [Sulfurimonas aquatica]|uniref:CheW-like domain-containing protein n=1 Tax=Sulfurimonas aquatica TaxID=2672570 RepID=A0A975B1A5_9BACT|nr:chemotaxis protein CheW [Sulfurimonas aquatica]QSZ42285.1 hypothetical protein GJV85_09260 [Sulfurimonas aquatica]